MANLKMKDFDGNPVYLKGAGAGTDLDPFTPVQDVNIQDQTTRPLGFYFSQIQGAPTTVAVQSVVDALSVTVASAASASVGDYFGMFEGSRFYFGTVLTLPGANVVTLDTPIDSVFTVGSTAAFFSRDMNVDGSTISQVFNVEVGGAALESIDITRIVVMMETDSAPAFSEFGDIVGGLTNGLVLRRSNGLQENIFNWKTNADIANYSYDLTILSSGGPLATDGIIARLTFAGQEKHGVAIRLDPGDKLASFRVIAQGHIVQP
jgi:hypothetical protein